VPDLDETIEQAAQTPARMAGDAGSVDQRSVAEIIAADKYLASKAQSRRTGWPLRLLRLSAGSTV
jgi:hypothetical protein